MSRFCTVFNGNSRKQQRYSLEMAICLTLVVSLVLLDFTELVQGSEPSQFVSNGGHLRARRSLASGRWGLRPGLIEPTFFFG
jgi:hypothetical protein